MTYEQKIAHAIRLLQSIPSDGPVEISISGGKDSDVILELAKMSGINYEAVYKQTSIDPPGTTAHVKAQGATILRPKKTFFQLVEEKGSPSRFKRFCCERLKEYKYRDRAVQGIRRAESTSRAKRYKEPEICRVYPHKEKVRVYLPILEWTDDDVVRFISERGLKCHPLYYDQNGEFHVERRLGCIGCPLQADNGLADFKRYPKFFKQYVKAYQRYLDKHTGSSWWQRVGGSALNACFYYLFCRSDEEYKMLTQEGQLFESERVNVREFMEGYFGVKFEEEERK